MKPFRFGVIVRSAGSRAEWVDQARKLEDLGYSSLTVPDHLAETFAPMPALVSAAAATVDLLTDGRLEVGLGAGYVKSEYERAACARRPRRSANVDCLSPHNPKVVGANPTAATNRRARVPKSGIIAPD